MQKPCTGWVWAFLTQGHECVRITISSTITNTLIRPNIMKFLFKIKLLKFLQCHTVVTSEALGTCERLSQVRYSAARQPGVKPATSWLQVEHPNHYTTKQLELGHAKGWSGTLLVHGSNMSWMPFLINTADSRTQTEVHCGNSKALTTSHSWSYIH